MAAQEPESSVGTKHDKPYEERNSLVYSYKCSKPTVFRYVRVFTNEWTNPRWSSGPSLQNGNELIKIRSLD